MLAHLTAWSLSFKTVCTLWVPMEKWSHMQVAQEKATGEPPSQHVKSSSTHHIEHTHTSTELVHTRLHKRGNLDVVAVDHAASVSALCHPSNRQALQEVVVLCMALAMPALPLVAVVVADSSHKCVLAVPR